MKSENSVHCFTSFTYSYLSRARLLAQTLRDAHPDWTIWAIIIDEPPAGFRAEEWTTEFDHVVPGTALGIPRYKSWLFKHDIVEACTAVKGQAMLMILAAGAEKVVYLDPDIAVFHPLTGIVEALDSASIVLTPHQVLANTSSEGYRDNELTSLQYGVFNLGFVAVRNDVNGPEFARWWADRLYDACYDQIEVGIFTDQKYCDLVPALFSGVYVERDPGYNVASWNLSKREMAFRRDGGIDVNGTPLKFYHFTKIGSEGDVMTERYARDNCEVFEVWNWYKRKIASNNPPGLPHRWWEYNNFSNGVRIQKRVRVLYRELPGSIERYDDPFSVGEGSFYAYLQRERPELLQSE